MGKPTNRVHKNGATKPAKSQDESLSKIRGAADDVCAATAQSNALLELIQNHLDYREHRCGTEFTREQVDTFNFGLDLLAHNTRERLAAATAGIMSAAYGKKVEVAS